MIVDDDAEGLSPEFVRPGKLSLIELFKVYSELIHEDKEVDYHRKDSLIKPEVSPLDFLEESTLFGSGVRSRSNSTESLQLTSRILEVTQYNEFNGSKFLSDMKERITSVNLKNDILLIGTAERSLHEISISKDSIIATSKLEGLATVVSISEDCSLVAAATTQGSILVKSANGGWGKKLINSKFENNYLDCMFFINSREIVAMSAGKILRFKIIKVSMILEVTSVQIILNESIPEKIPFKAQIFEERTTKKLIVMNPSEINFYKVTDKSQAIEYILSRPEEVSVGDNALIRQSGKSSLYTIFWGRLLLVIKKLNIVDEDKNDTKKPNEKKHSIELESMDAMATYQILEKIDIGFKFEVGLAFDEVGILAFNHEGLVRIGTIGNFSRFLKAGCYYEPEIRHFSDLKVFENKYEYLLKNLENKTIKLEDGTVLVVENNKFIRLRLMPTEKLIEDYVNCGEWHQAIKMAVKLFNSTPQANNDSRKLTRDLIRIISVKYINYFLPEVKVKEKLSFLGALEEEIQDKRLSVIIKTLMMSDSCDFVFEDLKSKLKPLPFWKAIGSIVKKSSNYLLKLEYLDKDLAELDQDQIVNIIEMTHKNVADRYSEDEEERIHRLAQTLKRKEYWTALFKLGLQFPQSKAIMIFLSCLLTQAIVKSSFQETPKATKPNPFTYSQLKAILSSPSPTMSLSQSDSVSSIRVFYYLRKFIQLDELIYFKSRTAVWQQVFDWLIEQNNLLILAELNISLALEIILESSLKSEIFLNQDFLYHLQKSIRAQFAKSQQHTVESVEVNSGKRGVRKLEDFEVKAYSIKVLKELLEYLKACLESKFGNKYACDIGFLSIKLLSVSLFKDLAKDTPFCFISLKSALSQPFKDDWFFYFYRLVNPKDFELTLLSCLNKTLELAAKINTTVLMQLKEIADSNK